MRYLIFMQITESGNSESFYTEWYSSENFMQDVGMIVFDLALKQFHYRWEILEGDNGRSFMKTLHLTLKKKWFDMIASGEKTEEYREIKPYWANRFTLLPPDFCKRCDVSDCAEYVWFDRYNEVHFVNGGNFHKSHPSITMECKGIVVSEGRAEWGAEPGKKYFVIKLGDKIV